MPRNAHVPPRIAPRAQIAEPPTRDEVRHDRRGVRRAARAGAPAVAAGQHRRVRVLHAVRARREPAARHHRPHHVDRMPSVLRAPRPARCALAARRPEPQPLPSTERPPPPLRSPAFAQVLDHTSGLGLSIHSVAAAASDWAKLKYGAKRGVPLLLYHRVVDELGCAPPRVHLHITCMCVEYALACVHGCGRSPVGALSPGALRRALPGGPATARTADQGFYTGTAATSSTPAETR